MTKLRKTVVALLTALAGSGPALALNGAGSTFINPLMSKWSYTYNKSTGVQINYQSIGSGGGIRQFSEGTVDFGASDAPMTPEQMQKVGHPVLHVPVIMGAVVVAYNVPGVQTGLHLSADVLASIFMGRIKRWNDPEIAALNAGMDLPAKDITVAHRSDGSGTTNIFTDYLSKANTGWATTVGKGTAVNWPAGVGGKGNEGVAGLIKQIPGTVGYVELAYAEKNGLSYALIRNRAGKYPEPNVDSVTAAAQGALKNMPADFRVSITNASGEGAYPISGIVWLLVKADKSSKNLVDFLKWIMESGQPMGKDLYYAPLPEALIQKVQDAIATIKT